VIAEMLSGGIGFTVNVALFDPPAYEPVIATFVADVTRLVLTTKPTLVAPAGTVTLVGTAAFVGLLLDSETTAPPEGAADDRVAVP